MISINSRQTTSGQLHEVVPGNLIVLIVLRLPYQAPSALAHIHSIGAVHCDLGLHNLLLTDAGNIVRCDFAGSRIDGSRCFLAPSTRYSDPLHGQEEVTQRHDVLSLGTLMYELELGGVMLDGLDDVEIYDRLERREFPELTRISMPLRSVIKKWWNVPEYTAEDALRELGGFPYLAVPVCTFLGRSSAVANAVIDAQPPRLARVVALVPAAAVLGIVVWRLWMPPRL